VVTVASGFDLEPDALKLLAKKLKSQLGTGGTIKECTIEIQGDYVLPLKEILAGMGFKIK
jgi:translation initiation factor 1